MGNVTCDMPIFQKRKKVYVISLNINLVCNRCFFNVAIIKSIKYTGSAALLHRSKHNALVYH